MAVKWWQAGVILAVVLVTMAIHHLILKEPQAQGQFHQQQQASALQTAVALLKVQGLLLEEALQGIAALRNSSIQEQWNQQQEALGAAAQALLNETNLLNSALRNHQEKLQWVLAARNASVRENTTAGHHNPPHPASTPRSASATRHYLPAPTPRPLGNHWPFSRMNDQRPFSYQCTDQTLRPETYPPHMPCLQQAARRIERAVQADSPGYPIGFCAPRRLVDYYHTQLWNVSKVSSVVGGIHGSMQGSRYSIFNEEEYLRKYASGHFVSTTKKAGWDCARHNEILLAGSLPLFDQLPDHSIHSLFHHPTECQTQFKNAQSGREDPAKLREGMYQWFSNHLTCDAMVHFMFRSVGFDPCAETPILFLDASAPTEPDYMSNLLLTGLHDVLGPAVHVWRPVDYLYMDYSGDHRRLYGNGFGYAYAVHPSLRKSSIPDSQVRERLRAKYYKAVVFGSYGRSIPFWDEVAQSLPRTRIWAVNGDDKGVMDSKYTSISIQLHRSGQVDHATIFVREMHRLYTKGIP